VAKRSAADLAKAKEAKQKKLLLVLLPFFLILVAWQGPKMYKSLFSQAPPPEATPAATTPTATTPATPAAPGTAATAPATGSLADSEPLPSAARDQLLSLSRFTSRNPFIPPPGTTPSPSEGGSGDQLVNVAMIEVNGQSEEVVYGATFPSSEPVFRLAGISEGGVQVGLAEGTFESGDQTVHIAVGEQVQLVADDGATYSVRLLSVDFKVPCLPIEGQTQDCVETG
jgi:hypothetical protein